MSTKRNRAQSQSMRDLRRYAFAHREANKVLSTWVRLLRAQSFGPGYPVVFPDDYLNIEGLLQTRCEITTTDDPQGLFEVSVNVSVAAVSPEEVEHVHRIHEAGVFWYQGRLLAVREANAGGGGEVEFRCIQIMPRKG